MDKGTCINCGRPILPNETAAIGPRGTSHQHYKKCLSALLAEIEELKRERDAAVQRELQTIKHDQENLRLLIDGHKRDLKEANSLADALQKERDDTEEGLTAAYMTGVEKGKDHYRDWVAQLEEALEPFRFSSLIWVDGVSAVRLANGIQSWFSRNDTKKAIIKARKALTSSPSGIAEVLRAARNFARVREFPDYNDKAHKSDGWYLAEAVRKYEEGK